MPWQWCRGAKRWLGTDVDLNTGIALASVSIALAGLGVATWTFKQTAELQAFLTLTERYENIMNRLPQSVRSGGAWGPEADPDFEIRLSYLNLCSEEFYLRKRRLLSGRVWGIWEEEIRAILSSRPYREAWKALEGEFESYPDFSQFVTNCQATSPQS